MVYILYCKYELKKETILTTKIGFSGVKFESIEPKLDFFLNFIIDFQQCYCYYYDHY